MFSLVWFICWIRGSYAEAHASWISPERFAAVRETWIFSGEPAMKDDAHSLDFKADGQLRTQRVDVVDVDIEEFDGFLAYRVVVFFDG